MNCTEFNEQLLDLFYHEAQAETRREAVLHRDTCADCAHQWQLLEAVEQRFAKWKSQDVPAHLHLSIKSQITKIRAESQRNRLVRPAWAVLATFLVATFGFYLGSHSETSQTETAQIHTPHFAPLMTTSPHLNPQPMNRHLAYPSLSAVSLSNSKNSQNDFGSIHFDIDDVLDQKILSRDLNARDLTAIFFRARNLEKLEYYQEALHDYEFLAHFEPGFENIKAVKISIARCLASLGDKQKAIHYLEKLSTDFPDDVRPLLDQLKSESL